MERNDVNDVHECCLPAICWVPSPPDFNSREICTKLISFNFKRKGRNCENATFVIFYIEIVCDFVAGIFDKSEHDYCASLQQPSAKRERDRRKERRGTLVTRKSQKSQKRDFSNFWKPRPQLKDRLHSSYLNL